MNPHSTDLGVWSLTCGILSILFSFSCCSGIIGLVAGPLALYFANRAFRDPRNDARYAKAGMVLGIIGLALSIIHLAITIVFIVRGTQSFWSS